MQGRVAQAGLNPGGIRESCPERRIEGLVKVVPEVMGPLDLIGKSTLELGRRRPGKGHHQQVLDVQLPLQQQPQVQARDVVGLAGTGARLDQVGAFQWQMGDVQRLHHATSVASVITRDSSRRP